MITQLLLLLTSTYVEKDCKMNCYQKRLIVWFNVGLQNTFAATEVEYG